MSTPLLTRYMVPSETDARRDEPTVDEPLGHASGTGQGSGTDTRITRVDRETTDDS